MSTEHITIKAFRAVDDKSRCVRYLFEHIRVLDELGVTSVVIPDLQWCSDPDVVVVVAEHPELGMVAGMRLHRSPLGHDLPMEASLKKLDPSVPAHVNALESGIKSEIAGLWNAHRFAGRGLPLLLISTGVALASQLGSTALVCVAANYMVPNTTRVGFENMKSIGENGVFRYPIETISSHAMAIHDLLTLATAQESDRHRILSLRLRPRQIRMEQPRSIPMTVTFDLLVDGVPSGVPVQPSRSRKAA